MVPMSMPIRIRVYFRGQGVLSLPGIDLPPPPFSNWLSPWCITYTSSELHCTCTSCHVYHGCAKVGPMGGGGSGGGHL